jgi:fatty-acyl-CoA synthase
MNEGTPPLSILHGPPLELEEGMGPLTLPGYLKELTQRYGRREAIVFHGSDGDPVRWTYDQLYERASDVARALIADGLGKNETVAVLMTNRPEWLAAVFGVALAGGVAAPLSTFSTAVELEYLLKTSCASVLLMERHVLKKDFLDLLYQIEPNLSLRGPDPIESLIFPFLRRIIVFGGAELKGKIRSWDDFLESGQNIDRTVVEARSESVRPADPALLYFSSGSTGRPKGIQNSQRAVSIQCWRWSRVLGFNDQLGIRGWAANGFFWSGAFAQTAGATLSSGGTLVLQSTFNAEQALRLFEAERVNYLVCWPHQYAQFPEAPNWHATDLSSLRYMTNDQGSVIEKHPSAKADWREPLAYGSTETFTMHTCFPVGSPVETWGNTYGVPLPGNHLKIVDAFSGEVVPVGQRGEIALKGATLMMGYIGVPLDETLDYEGYYHTGDGGYVDDQGRLVWEGRLNDIIKTGGANVSALEVDEVIRGCPDVKIVQTVGVPDDLYGEIIVACVVRHAHSQLDEGRVRAFAKERLASYKIPKRILFFAEDELVVTGSAKVVVADLRTLATERLQSESVVTAD